MNYFKKSPTVFCPVCSTERDVPKVKKRWLVACLKSLAWSGLWGMVAYLFWGLFAAVWVAALTGVLCFLILEVYDSVKFKRELVCPVCQFDPILYRRSPEQAKQRCLKSLNGSLEAKKQEGQSENEALTQNVPRKQDLTLLRRLQLHRR